MTTPTLRTYCTGGDLFGVGAAAAGYRVVDGYEIDAKKAAVAQRNGHDVRVADVTCMDMDSLSPVWHEHWSPSCKTASQANTAGGETPDDIAVAEACARSIAAHAARGGRSWSLENVWGYRNYESFAKILAALAGADFEYVFDHVNMADFGVPQTRKRLILRAVHRSWRGRVPGLRPTHSQRGGAMLERWVGWLPSIADLLHTLPETQPAPWQLQRMGRLPDSTMLVEKHGAGDRPLVQRRADEPAWTVRGRERQEEAAIAYLVSNAKTEYGDGLRDAAEPALSVTSQQAGRLRAYLVGGGNTNLSDPTSLPRPDDQPAFTVRDGRNGSPERAFLDGHWVKITLPCLARFQTVPDDYIGLTAEINGNGVPPLFAQRLMESYLR